MISHRVFTIEGAISHGVTSQESQVSNFQEKTARNKLQSSSSFGWLHVKCSIPSKLRSQHWSYVNQFSIYIPLKELFVDTYCVVIYEVKTQSSKSNEESVHPIFLEWKYLVRFYVVTYCLWMLTHLSHWVFVTFKTWLTTIYIYISIIIIISF